MSTNNKKSKEKTTGAEWISFVVLGIFVIVVIIIIFAVLIPRLFQGSSADRVGLPPAKGCTTSPGPMNLQASQSVLSVPNIDIAWNPVIATETPGEIILGYNVYMRTDPGITKANTSLTTFTVVPQNNVRIISTGPIRRETTYYYKVSTLDTCGEGNLSAEEKMFTTG